MAWQYGMLQAIEEARRAKDQNGTAGFPWAGSDCLGLLFLSNHMLERVSCFLRNRMNRLEIQGEMLEPIPTGPRWVVQGGWSSGDLFTLLLNDLPNQMTTKVWPGKG